MNGSRSQVLRHRTAPENAIVDEIAKQVDELAGEVRAEGAEAGAPTVMRVAPQPQSLMRIGRKW